MHFEIDPTIATLWIESLGLETLQATFYPQVPPEIQHYLQKPIEVRYGSLLKIIAKKREKYIPEIRPTLEQPDFVFRDKKGQRGEAIIFARFLQERIFFTSIIEEGEHSAIVISNAPKKDNNLLRKMKKGEVIYIGSQTSSSSALKAFTGILSSTNRTDTKEPSIKIVTKKQIKRKR